jgi:hypothetical protein
MGYYSEVALVLDQKASRKLNKMLKDAPEERSQFFELHCDCTKEDQKTGSKLFHWESIRWDEFDDEDVIFTDTFMNSLSEDQYCFIRIGEICTDIEERGTFSCDPFNARVTSQISFDS